MSLLASTSFLTSQIEGLTNGAKQQAGEGEVSKSGKPPQPRQEVDEEDLDNGDFHQVDNNGNLDNGEPSGASGGQFHVSKVESKIPPGGIYLNFNLNFLAELMFHLKF